MLLDEPLIRTKPTRIALSAIILVVASGAALSHIRAGSVGSFGAGVAHQLSGYDHIMVMVMVGIWAALKGGRALWAWPAAFIGLMVVGGAIGIAGLPVPFVEPAILASIVTLGLLVAAAVDLPVAAGAVVIGVFAFCHGHAHGTEIPQNMGGLKYLAGFVVATAIVHAAGIGFVFAGPALSRCCATCGRGDRSSRPWPDGQRGLGETLVPTGRAGWLYRRNHGP